MKKRKIVLCAALGLMSYSAQAVTVNVSTSAANPQNTEALTGFATTGAMMDGMKVTATFIDGFVQTLIWGDTGATSGGVAGSGWQLSESGDTFNGLWNLSNTRASAMQYLQFDAGVGNTVFDIAISGSAGSAGSENGRTFEVASASNTSLALDAVYSGPVGLAGAAPKGDLYRFLDLTFLNSGFSGTLSFRTDTDNLKFAGDIAPVPDGGSTAALLGLGFLALLRTRKGK